MYKIGDKVQFIEHESFGIFSGKKGTIEKRINDGEVEIEDNMYASKCVYEVYVPFHGNVQVLDGFIKHING